MVRHASIGGSAVSLLPLLLPRVPVLFFLLDVGLIVVVGWSIIDTIEFVKCWSPEPLLLSRSTFLSHLATTTTTTTKATTFSSLLLSSAAWWWNGRNSNDNDNDNRNSNRNGNRNSNRNRNSNSNSNNDVVRFPLRYLPRAGCLAISISVRDSSSTSSSSSSFRYLAVVDTGSPFWTVPSPPRRRRRRREEDLAALAYDCSDRFGPSMEQYGEILGEMRWIASSNVYLGTSDDHDNDDKNDYKIAGEIVMGVPEATVVEGTGGIFFGLLYEDDFRPTVLHQMGYSSFALDYESQELILSKLNLLSPSKSTSMSASMSTSTSTSLPSRDTRRHLSYHHHDHHHHDHDDSTVMTMFDLSPYGPNLHHYGVLSDEIELQIMRSNQKTWISTRPFLQRPVVVVFDTGLTGCIFSDSWLRDLPFFSDAVQMRDDISGVQIRLPSGQVLRSHDGDDDHDDAGCWIRPSCFRLPWFSSANDDRHPHILAVGASLLCQTRRITVDAIQRRIRLDQIVQDPTHDE